jgi:hypothetical protein
MIWIICLVSKFNISKLLLEWLLHYFKCNIHRIIFWRWPIFEFTLLNLDNMIINISFIFESIKLLEPCLCHYFTIDCCFERIRPKNWIFLLILKNFKSSVNRLYKIIFRMIVENKSWSFFIFKIEFLNWVFKPACFISNNRCFPNKKFMLYNSARLKYRRH